MLIIQTIYGPKGRQIGYEVLDIETQSRVAVFKNRDHGYNWRRAKAAAESYFFSHS